jgi:hypothetical protein
VQEEPLALVSVDVVENLLVERRFREWRPPGMGLAAVNSAEPWVRGSTPTSQVEGADVFGTAAVHADAAGQDGSPKDVVLHVLEQGVEELSSACRPSAARCISPRRSA